METSVSRVDIKRTVRVVRDWMFVREERVEPKRTKSVETGTMCWARRLKDYRDWQVDVVYCLFTQSEERENSKKDNKREPGLRRNDGEESQRHLWGDERIRKEGIDVIGWWPQHQRMREQKKPVLIPILTNFWLCQWETGCNKNKIRRQIGRAGSQKFFPFWDVSILWNIE